MPAPPLANTFDGGTDGVYITNVNSGGASGDAFSGSAGADPLYSSARWHSGPLSMRIVDSAGANVYWNGLGALTTDVWFRFYMYLSALSSDNNFYPMRFSTAADASCGIIRILSSGSGGVLQMRNAANSQIGTDSAVGVATGKWVRIEVRVKASTTAGEMEYRLFNTADSTTADATGSATSAVLAATLDWVKLGIQIAAPASPFTVYYDDFVVSTTDWIGPLEASPPGLSDLSSRKPRFVYLRKNR